MSSRSENRLLSARQPYFRRVSIAQFIASFARRACRQAGAAGEFRLWTVIGGLILVVGYLCFPGYVNHFFHYLLGAFNSDLHRSFHGTSSTTTTTAAHAAHAAKAKGK